MYRDGHLGVAMLGYSPIAYLLTAVDLTVIAALGLVGVGVGCTLPDLDLKLPVLSHRGLTHSIVGAVVVGLGYAAVGVFLVARGILGPPSPVGYVLGGLFAFGIGVYAVVLHLAGDVLTPMGIRPLQPFSDAEYSANLVRAANKPANQVLLYAGAIALVVAFVLGTRGLSWVLNLLG